MDDMGTLARQGLQNSTSAGFKESIAEAAQQRWTEIEDGKAQYTSGTLNHLTANAMPVEREFYDFYRTERGELALVRSTPELTTHPTFSSFTKFVNCYLFSGIQKVSPRPLIFISGDQAHSREFSDDAYSRAAEPKELLWVPGAGHVDLYDRIELIPFQ
ncbi:Alpha/Beta hydrolase protein [Penicillium macrosclerotiorum]|uniref:Alpha/Beta hydrolase protein n=1 Tax=Penicillium macrosclerotiorum TaxID=303699 RepID=UPI002547D330|nr:Alpha/Beta hydrolase protein [Penicillium macrosclerotiorum]KAJ5698418.1 Alpha/Beta hydrolase protein [Penicillium macrosclerotiorum]